MKKTAILIFFIALPLLVFPSESESNVQKANVLIDRSQSRLNFYSEACPDCQDQNLGQNLEARLNQEGFTKKRITTTNQRRAHCFGVTLFFVKHLLTHPSIESDSCQKILSDISSDPIFKHLAHTFHVNQHSYYFLGDSEAVPLELTPPAMKNFFRVLIEKTPTNYNFVPFEEPGPCLDQATIYAALKKLPRKVSMIGYTDREGDNHCVAICTHPNKLLIFDSNEGLYQISDLETLSAISAKILNEKKFRWIISFDMF